MANALLGLTIQKGVDIRKPVDVVLSVESQDFGRIDIELTADQFAHLLGGTNLSVDAQWRKEV
jgi:hypothetical protein